MNPVADLPAPPRERCPELAPLLSHLLGRLGGMAAGLSRDGREYLRKILDSIRYAESIHSGTPIEGHMWRNEPWMLGAVYICAACGKRVVWRDGAWREERLAGHDWVRRAEGWTKMPNSVKPTFVCSAKPFVGSCFIPTEAERRSSYKPAQAAAERLAARILPFRARIYWPWPRLRWRRCSTCKAGSQELAAVVMMHMGRKIGVRLLPHSHCSRCGAAP